MFPENTISGLIPPQFKQNLNYKSYFYVFNLL